MSDQDRVEVVEALLRNRAGMLDPKGRPMPGLSIFGAAPTDEEFSRAARAIVEATGKDQRAALRQVDAFEDELVQRVDQAFDKLEKTLGIEGEDGSDLPPPPPP